MAPPVDPPSPGSVRRGGAGFTASDIHAIRDAIRTRYAGVASSAVGKFRYPTGREGALALGYDPALVETAPAGALESFCGVGNPFSLGTVHPGARVLDFGCGAGFDLFVAGRLTGAAGQLFGVDLTADMVEQARHNLALAGLANFTVSLVASEELPHPDIYFDLVISNGVINLSPCKQACFQEMYRVLKPGGALWFADVLLDGELPVAMAGSAESWSQ